MRTFLLALGALVSITSAPAVARGENDGAVRQAIIQESIDAYPGNCPCPYNRARNGSQCGGRSAYSRAGGYAPKCFPADVSDAEVRAWRARGR